VLQIQQQQQKLPLALLFFGAGLVLFRGFGNKNVRTRGQKECEKNYGSREERIGSAQKGAELWFLGLLHQFGVAFTLKSDWGRFHQSACGNPRRVGYCL
jgi:hypothetical protein